MTSGARDSSSSVAVLSRAPMTNDLLIEGLREGELHASAELYDRFGDHVNRLVWRLLGADSEHNDVVHNIFILLLGSIGKLRSTGSLRAWVTGIAINTVRKELRNRSYRHRFTPIRELPEIAEGARDTDRQLLVNRFYGVLDELSADERVVFVLRFLERQTIDEVARSCGFSPSTAKRRIARARATFIERAGEDSILCSLKEKTRDA